MRTFSDSYPTIARWIAEQGWIELGSDEMSDSLIRALDPGGMVWESDADITSLDHALAELEQALIDWFDENG
ncbi:MAG: hypothetical protein KAX40_06730 [Herpetosiphon sp.]|nr:hypothetical protein [Herpetosiphon sp.]